MTLTDEQVAAIDRLDSALCNFLNAASDAYDPRKWIPETRRNFARLSDAYNLCHSLGVMDLREARARRSAPNPNADEGERK
jgi:hypothetical protein